MTSSQCFILARNKHKQRELSFFTECLFADCFVFFAQNTLFYLSSPGVGEKKQKWIDFAVCYCLCLFRGRMRRHWDDLTKEMPRKSAQPPCFEGVRRLREGFRAGGIFAIVNRAVAKGGLCGEHLWGCRHFKRNLLTNLQQILFYPVPSCSLSTERCWKLKPFKLYAEWSASHKNMHFSYIVHGWVKLKLISKLTAGDRKKWIHKDTKLMSEVSWK